MAFRCSVQLQTVPHALPRIPRKPTQNTQKTYIIPHILWRPRKPRIPRKPRMPRKPTQNTQNISNTSTQETQNTQNTYLEYLKKTQNTCLKYVEYLPIMPKISRIPRILPKYLVWVFQLFWVGIVSIFEPTWALCTVGSYASLSVRLSVRLAGLYQNSAWTIIHISESIAVRNPLLETLPLWHVTMCLANELAVDYCCHRQGSLPTSSCIFLYSSFSRQVIQVFRVFQLFQVVTLSILGNQGFLGRTRATVY